MNRKTVPMRVRLTQYQMLQISELAEMTGTSVAAVVRAAVMKYVEELQDEDGNWELPRRVYKQKKTFDEASQANDEDPCG